jgi:hypothetical protein
LVIFQVHVDKYDPSDALWNGFEGRINRVDILFNQYGDTGGGYNLQQNDATLVPSDPYSSGND